MSDDTGVNVLRVAERFAPEVVYLALKEAEAKVERLREADKMLRWSLQKAWDLYMETGDLIYLRDAVRNVVIPTSLAAEEER